MSDINKKIINLNKNSANVSKTQIKKNIISRDKIIKIIFYVLLILLILIILYIIIFFIKFKLTDCYEYRNFLDYLTSMRFNDICIYKYKPASKKDRIYKDENEVFNIANQDYTYEQAKCKCEAYNSRLATREEIIKSFNKGANWCNYGWSEGQNAFFPVQKCYWDKMQKNDETKNTCGLEAGVNGGYFPNSELRFGANCYGIRPKGQLAIEKKPYCKEKPVCERKANRFSNKIKDTDIIASFNNEQWSQFIN